MCEVLEDVYEAMLRFMTVVQYQSLKYERETEFLQEIDANAMWLTQCYVEFSSFDQFLKLLVTTIIVAFVVTG